MQSNLTLNLNLNKVMQLVELWRRAFCTDSIGNGLHDLCALLQQGPLLGLPGLRHPVQHCLEARATVG